MVQRRKLKRIQRRAKDTQKSLLALLLIFGFFTMIFVSVNARGFTAFISGAAIPFSGDISFVGMSVEGEEQRFDPVGQFSKNFDGVPNWIDYLASLASGDMEPVVHTCDYPDLIGMPMFMPETSWSFSTISHIDMSIDDPMVIEDATLPSTFQVTEGLYTEVYRYMTDIYLRVHAEAEMESLGPSGSATYALRFTNGFSGNQVQSRYIGEYAPMYEMYAKIGIDVKAINSSIVLTGADMAANGEPEVRFWPWAATPTWNQDVSWNLANAYEYIQDNLHDGAVLNSDILQTGFDQAQGFNIVDKTEGANSYYEFNVGFNYIGVPGCFYEYYDWYFLIGWHQGLELLDMEVRIPVTFNIVVVYAIEEDNINLLYELYPELQTSGKSVHIIGTAAIPTNSSYGDYFPDNPVIGVYESIPGFDWLKGEFGAMAFLVLSVVIGVGAALLFRRR